MAACALLRQVQVLLARTDSSTPGGLVSAGTRDGQFVVYVCSRLVSQREGVVLVYVGSSLHEFRIRDEVALAHTVGFYYTTRS